MAGRSLETQVKYRLAADEDPRALAARLEAAGYQYQEDVSTYDTYYQGPGLDPGCTLRLRTEHGGPDDEATLLTWKGPDAAIGEVSVREELETMVGEDLAVILKRLHFEPLATLTKHQWRYRKEHVLGSVDFVDGLGVFFELQVVLRRPSNAADGERLLAEGAKLGFGKEHLVEETYHELALAQAAKGSAPR